MKLTFSIRPKRRAAKPDCDDGQPCGRSCVNRKYKCSQRLKGSVVKAVEWLLTQPSGSSGPKQKAAKAKVLGDVRELKGKAIVRLREYKSFATGDGFETAVRNFLKNPQDPAARAAVQDIVNKAYDKKRREGESMADYQKRAYNRDYEVARASMDIALAETLPRREGESTEDYIKRKDDEKFAAAKRMVDNALISPSTGLPRVIDDEAMDKLWSELGPKERAKLTKRGSLAANSEDYYDPATGGNGKLTDARGKAILKRYLEQGGVDIYTGLPISVGASNLEHINPYGFYGKRAENLDNWGFTEGALNRQKGQYETSKNRTRENLQSYTDWLGKNIFNKENDGADSAEWQRREREVNQSQQQNKARLDKTDRGTVEAAAMREAGKTDAEVMIEFYNQWQSGEHGIIPKKKAYYAARYAGFSNSFVRPGLRGARNPISNDEVNLAAEIARKLKDKPEEFEKARQRFNDAVKESSDAQVAANARAQAGEIPADSLLGISKTLGEERRRKIQEILDELV